MLVNSGDEPLVATLEGGAGLAWSGLGGRLLLYSLLDGSIRVHGALEHGYSAGPGGHIGALLDPVPRWRLQAYARSIKYMAGERDQPYAWGLQQRVALGRDVALRIDVAKERQAASTWNTGAVSVLYYF